MCDENHKYVNQGACSTYLVGSTNFWIVQDEHWHRGLITMSRSNVISRKSVHYGTLRFIVGKRPSWSCILAQDALIETAISRTRPLFVADIFSWADVFSVAMDGAPLHSMPRKVSDDIVYPRFTDP